jgi:hypothetical protein
VSGRSGANGAGKAGKAGEYVSLFGANTDGHGGR